MLKPDHIAERPPQPLEVDLASRLPAASRQLAPLLGRWLLRLIPVVLLAAAAAVLWHEFHALSLGEVVNAMAAWGDLAVLSVIGLSIASFALMGVIEWLGLRWCGCRLPWGVAMGGSFLANAIAHALGANLLVSGAVRARLYKRFGVGLTQVAATTLFGGMTFAVGLSALSGAGLLLASPADLEATALPAGFERGLGALLVSFALGYVALCAVRRRPLVGFGRSVTLPSWRDAVLQVVIGVVDNGIAAAIIWTLLPDETSYLSFVGAYAIACVAGLASSVPGGAGVFESTLAALLTNTNAAVLAAAFLGYRLFFYVAPLLIASLALAAETLIRRKDA